MFAHGKTFARLDLMGDALGGIAFTDSDAEYAYVELYPEGQYNYDSAMNNALAVNRNAANPERLLLLLELLDTNQEAYDLFMYGIHGETYDLDETGTVQYPEGQSMASSEYLGWPGWAFKRIKFDRPSGKYTSEVQELEKEWLEKDNFTVSPLDGFGPDTKPIMEQMEERSRLYEEEGLLLLAGILKGKGVEEAVDDYIDAQEKAGTAVILDFLQKEADQFIEK